MPNMNAETSAQSLLLCGGNKKIVFTRVRRQTVDEVTKKPPIVFKTKPKNSFVKAGKHLSSVYGPILCLFHGSLSLLFRVLFLSLQGPVCNMSLDL